MPSSTIWLKLYGHRHQSVPKWRHHPDCRGYGLDGCRLTWKRIVFVVLRGCGWVKVVVGFLSILCHNNNFLGCWKAGFLRSSSPRRVYDDYYFHVEAAGCVPVKKKGTMCAHEVKVGKCEFDKKMWSYSEENMQRFRLWRKVSGRKIVGTEDYLQGGFAALLLDVCWVSSCWVLGKAGRTTKPMAERLWEMRAQWMLV